MAQAPIEQIGTPGTDIMCAGCKPYWIGDTVPAKSTDGVEPDYTTEPVTQKIAHCSDGWTLKQFDPNNYPDDGIVDENKYWIGKAFEHVNRWIDAPEDASNKVFLSGPIYRCFPDEYKENGVAIFGDCIKNGCNVELPEDSICIKNNGRMLCMVPPGQIDTSQALAVRLP